MTRRAKPVLAVIGAALLGAPAVAQQAPPAAAVAQESKQRLIVLSDIGAEPDDTQSLVRLMLYSNQIDIEGLIATTSVWMKHQRNPRDIRDVVSAYAKVRSNLLLHEPGFPTAERLLSLVAEGQPGYGVAGIGRGKESAGSHMIVEALTSADPRPLWVVAWGGVNTLAQALETIRSTRSEAEANRLVAKLRVYTISDQDDAGPWLRSNFPELFFIMSPGSYGNATWTAINTVVEGIDNSSIGNAWLAKNIQQGHGPLGAAYPDVGWGMEGDTPSFLGLIPNGLNYPDRPDFGGWGGRYELHTPSVDGLGSEVNGGIPIRQETRPIWSNAIDSFAPFVNADYNRATKAGTRTFKDFRTTLWRWRDDFQNDFAARMSWTTLPHDEANHPPVVQLATPERVTVRAGGTVGLSAAGTTDPDGDSLSYLWFHYPEAGSWKTPIAIDGAENVSHASFTAPVVGKPETVHIILRVVDKGTPPIARYKRAIVTILPK